MRVTLFGFLFALPLFLSGQGYTSFPDPPKELTISDIMKKAHRPLSGNKGPTLLSKVVKGQATAEEQKELLRLYKELPKLTPPNGTQTSWNEKTSILIADANLIIQGGPEADSVRKKYAGGTGGCLACHKSHRK